MLTLITVGLSFALAAAPLSGTSDTKVEKVPFDASKWKLVWRDEFDNGTMPNPKDWVSNSGTGQNNEQQFYTKDRPANARLTKGCLEIQGLIENWEGRRYTSARITTSGKRSFLYGRIEARAKIPTGRGTWPAIWLLGESLREVGWPKCGEIDILENVGFDPHAVYANIHVDAYNHMKHNGKGSRMDLKQPDKEFHLYAVEWYKDRLEFFVDDQRYFIYRKESDDPAVWPFNKPHYLIINLAIGGDWGGIKGIDDQAFPHKFDVDYVRYYKLKNE